MQKLVKKTLLFNDTNLLRNSLSWQHNLCYISNFQLYRGITDQSDMLVMTLGLGLRYINNCHFVMYISVNEHQDWILHSEVSVFNVCESRLKVRLRSQTPYIHKWIFIDDIVLYIVWVFFERSNLWLIPNIQDDLSDRWTGSYDNYPCAGNDEAGETER